MLEETGLRVELVGERREDVEDPVQLRRPAGVQLESIEPGHQHIDLIYFARPSGSTEVEDDYAEDKVGWYGPKDWDAMDVNAEVRGWCEKALRDLEDSERERSFATEPEDRSSRRTQEKGTGVTEDVTERKVEVQVGRVGPGDKFLGEKVRFRGQELGSYPDPSTVDDPNGRAAVTYTLYRCPGGYRVYREEYKIYPEKKRYRSGRGREGHSATLLPVAAEQGASHEEQTPVYGIYSEEEAREAFPWLFSALGKPNVRDLD